MGSISGNTSREETPTPTARGSRFRDAIDPDLLAASASDGRRGSPLIIPVPTQELAADGDEDISVPSSGGRRDPRGPTQNAGNEAAAPSTPNDMRKKYRFRDEIDPDLLATARKPRAWADLSAVDPGSTPSPSAASWGRRKPGLLAGHAATTTPTSTAAPGSAGKRTRSTSPLSFVPDTPPPKRQQQHQRQPSTVDEIEDVDTSSSPPLPSHKRQKSDGGLSPTSPTPVLKRQRVLVDAEKEEDGIEDGPDSSPLPHPTPTPAPAPEGVDGVATPSGDEVDEHVDPSAAPGTSTIATTTESHHLRRLLDPAGLYFKLTQPAPPPTPLQPRMINILTHHKQLIVAKHATPPPPSPPRGGYIEGGLAETAMWWKHDVQERHKRMFTQDKATLTCRVVVREFLRDGGMCFIKGRGSEQESVRVVVAERAAAEAVTRSGVVLLYAAPWFLVRLAGEAEPYRFLVGSWRVEKGRAGKGKGKGKARDVGMEGGVVA